MILRFLKVSERSEHSKSSKFVWQKKYTYFLGISAHLRSDDEMFVVMLQDYTGAYKKGLNLFSRLSSKCELIFDWIFFSVHKKLALSVKEKRIAVT